MKRIIVTFIFLANITIGLFAQSELFYYGDNGKKESFKIRKDKAIIKTKSTTEAQALSKNAAFRSAYDVNYNWIIATIDTLQTKLNELNQRPDVVDATYALEYFDGTLQYLTDRIFVEYKEGISMEKLFDEIGLSKNVETIELFDSWSDIYLITLNVELGDILKICQNLFESGLCKSANPVFICETKPDNTYYSYQWQCH